MQAMPTRKEIMKLPIQCNGKPRCPNTSHDEMHQTIKETESKENTLKKPSIHGIISLFEVYLNYTLRSIRLQMEVGKEFLC